jgi:hypothetical protein
MGMEVLLCCNFDVFYVLHSRHSVISYDFVINIVLYRYIIVSYSNEQILAYM